jgi:hypothetical protein
MVHCYICKHKGDLIKPCCDYVHLNCLTNKINVECRKCSNEYSIKVDSGLYFKELCHKSFAIILCILSFAFYLLTLIGFNFNFNKYPFFFFAIIAYILMCTFALLFIFRNDCENMNKCVYWLFNKYKMDYLSCYVLTIDILLFLSGIINLFIHLVGSLTIFIFNAEWHSKIPFMFYYTLAVGSCTIGTISLSIFILYWLVQACIYYIGPSTNAIIIEHV